ncbi:hypothetical protein [Brevibacterium litoralis]|uniref:hypothetical protein n=1 Tax=Brevibacterium litoralis TaxID=3138935 RepID=UPI0032EAA825
MAQSAQGTAAPPASCWSVGVGIIRWTAFVLFWPAMVVAFVSPIIVLIILLVVIFDDLPVTAFLATLAFAAGAWFCAWLLFVCSPRSMKRRFAGFRGAAEETGDVVGGAVLFTHYVRGTWLLLSWPFRAIAHLFD